MNNLTTLAFLLLALGLARSNYEYDYEESYSHHYHDLQLPEFTVEFTVEKQTYTVQEGGDINISCAVSGTTPYVLIVKKVWGWEQNEELLLFVGEILITLSLRSRYEINDGIMTIRNVNKNDAGEYMCYFETEPVVEVKHKLEVQYAPVISSSTPKNQRVPKGDFVTLECEAEGNPTPNISWSRIGGHLPAGSVEVGRSMTFLDVDRHVEGTYICKADNGVGNPATEEMSISVEYAPEIITQKAIIHTDKGDKVEFVCVVYSRPTAEVTWQKDGSLVDHEPNIEESKGGHRHTLMLDNITEEMFGNYTCYAKNNNGEADATIILNDLPNGGEETSYTQTIETESYYPITESQPQGHTDTTITEYQPQGHKVTSGCSLLIGVSTSMLVFVVALLLNH